MRPNQLRRRLALMAFGGMLAAATITTGVARADGHLSDTEAAFAATYGQSLICSTLAAHPDTDGVLGVGVAVMSQGFAPDSAADIVTASVAAFCPEFLGLLQRVGDTARGTVLT